MPLTKPPGTSRKGTVLLDDRAWGVRFTRAVSTELLRWGLANPDFRPTLQELLEELALNPYQFPEKRRGKLVGARAADLRFRGKTWRLVFDIDEEYREIFILAIGEHDKAYDDAERRR
jgi:mRNA-degrading endonuclease RelE of RelBE toxin-antitoxin system